MTGYIVDTNILIYYLAALFLQGKSLPSTGFSGIFYIFVITRIELLGWKHHSDEVFMKARTLLDCARTIPLSDALAEKTIEIRRMNAIPLADAVIAATALSLDATLVTRNEKDFDNVANLRIYNPFQ